MRRLGAYRKNFYRTEKSSTESIELEMRTCKF